MAHDGKKPLINKRYRIDKTPEVDGVKLLTREFRDAQGYCGNSWPDNIVYVSSYGDGVMVTSGDSSVTRHAMLSPESAAVLLQQDNAAPCAFCVWMGYETPCVHNSMPAQWVFHSGVKWQAMLETGDKMAVRRLPDDALRVYVGDSFYARLPIDWESPGWHPVLPDPADVPQTVALPRAQREKLAEYFAATSTDKWNRGKMGREWRDAHIAKSEKVRTKAMHDDGQYGPLLPERLLPKWQVLHDLYDLLTPLGIQDLEALVEALNRVTNPVIRYGEGAVAVVTGDELVWYTLARNV